MIEQIHKQHQGMPSRVKKPRSEQKRASGVGSSPASKASKAQANANNSSTTVAAVSTPTVTQAPAAVAEVQIPAAATSVPLPVTVLKTSPIKLNNASVMAVRQDAR